MHDFHFFPLLLTFSGSKCLKIMEPCLSVRDINKTSISDKLRARTGSLAWHCLLSCVIILVRSCGNTKAFLAFFLKQKLVLHLVAAGEMAGKTKLGRDTASETTGGQSCDRGKKIPGGSGSFILLRLHLSNKWMECKKIYVQSFKFFKTVWVTPKSILNFYIFMIRQRQTNLLESLLQ